MVANTPALVEVRNLRKDYGNQLAVKDVSFSCHGGEVLGLLGPNGAGKSTVMTMIAGLLEPTSGNVILNGETEYGIATIQSGTCVFESDWKTVARLG